MTGPVYPYRDRSMDGRTLMDDLASSFSGSPTDGFGRAGASRRSQIVAEIFQRMTLSSHAPE